MTQQADDIRNMIATRYNVAPEKVTDNASLVLDLHLSSLEHVEMVMDLEIKFHLNITADNAENLKTVGDVIKLVAEMTADV